MNILIGISWPYANGELHLGHVASSLSGDVIARYHRAIGNQVILVSGSDAHGTGIDIEAIKTKKNQKEIVDYHHSQLKQAFNNLDFSFDLYNRTDDEYHKKFVQESFLKFYKKGLIYELEEEQLYCKHCQILLADRYIIGTCPHCGSSTKGDECDECGALLKMEDVIHPHCAICHHETTQKKTKNLYFSFSKFQKQIESLLEEKKDSWRTNAISFTKRYLNEGLPDRCVSRSLKWGIDIPIVGYEDKKIYVWCENVFGYISACQKYCETHRLDWQDFWKEGNNIKSYFIHAKDNIPFHTIILPSLLLGLDENYHLPDYIISDEYLTLEGKKLSKSKGNYISANEIVKRYPSDIIRYYFISHDPSKKDLNFSWTDFIHSHNGILLGKWGNLVNRTLLFINKSFDGTIEKFPVEPQIEQQLIKLYDQVGNLINQGDCKEAILLVFDYISYANKYFDKNEPWVLAKTNKDACQNILYQCVNIIFNINNILKVFLPNSNRQINQFLQFEIEGWNYQSINSIHLTKDILPLYQRYDKKQIEEEIQRLKEKRNTR